MSQLLKSLEKLDKKSKETRGTSQALEGYYLHKGTQNYVHFFMISLVFGLVLALTIKWAVPLLKTTSKKEGAGENLMLTQSAQGQHSLVLASENTEELQQSNQAFILEQTLEAHDPLPIVSTEQGLALSLLENPVEQVSQKESKPGAVEHEQRPVTKDQRESLQQRPQSPSMSLNTPALQGLSADSQNHESLYEEHREPNVTFDSEQNLFEYEMLGSQGYEHLLEKKHFPDQRGPFFDLDEEPAQLPDIAGMKHFSNNKELIKSIEKLRYLKMKHKFRQYERLLDYLQDKYPENLLLMRIAANYALEQGQYRQYVNAMREAIESYREKEDIVDLSKFYLKEHRPVDLIQTLSLLDRSCCSDQDVLEMLGYAYLETAQWAKATEAYSKLTKAWPHQPSYWLGHAKSLEKRKIYDKALQSYHQALNLQPQQSIQKLAVAGVIRLKSYEYTELQKNTTG